MDIPSSLHKSLQAHWTTPILCRNLNNAGPNSTSLLEGIRSNFSSYDNKVKLKILLSFLGVKRDVISANAMLIKKILELTSLDAALSDSWITNIAGIVHRRLFTVKSGYESIEQPLNEKFDHISQAIINYLNSIDSSTTTTQYQSLQGILGEDPFYFHSHEAIYTASNVNSLIDSTTSSNSHFQCSGKVPNFLEREKIRGKERIGSSGMKRTFALADSIKSAPTEHRLFSSSSSASSRASQGGSGKTSLVGSLLSAGSKEMNSQQRKPMQILDFHTVKEMQEASKALPVEKPEASADTAPKKRSKADTSSITKTSQPAIPTPDSQPVSATSGEDSHVAMKAPDLDALFAESPLLTDTDKVTIRSFFSIDGPTLFPAGNPELKFSLSKQEKMNPNGEVVVETIRLRLICTPHQNWQKSRSTKAKDKV